MMSEKLYEAVKNFLGFMQDAPQKHLPVMTFQAINKVEALRKAYEEAIEPPPKKPVEFDRDGMVGGFGG